MTQHDNLLQEVARLTQRQDQLEQQQRETATRADYLKRDVDTLRSDVNRRIDYLRRDMDSRSRDGERRVSSLEWSRNTVTTIFRSSIPLVVAIVFFIIVVTAAIASREQRQEPGEPQQREPQQRSPSSFHAPPLGAGFADDVDADRMAPRATIVGL